MATPAPMMVVIYHKTLGESPPMYATHAHSAVKDHPLEWSFNPWPVAPASEPRGAAAAKETPSAAAAPEPQRKGRTARAA